MAAGHELELQELLKEVRRIEVQSSRLATGIMAGEYHSVFRGSGIEFDEVREYVEGDDPRSIDWNVTARAGRPQVKKFVDERQQTVLFLLDLSASMSGGFGPWSARQVAARVVATLAQAAVRNQDRVGLVAFSDRVEQYLPPAKGGGAMLRIVRDCLALPAASAGTDLVPALRFTARVARRHSIVFLVSDFQTGGWRQAAGACARRHDLIAVRLLSPELQPPAGGLARLRDPETGAVRLVDWSHRPTRQAYLRRVADWRREVERDLRWARVDRMDVPVPRVRGGDVVARPLLGFFRMRELRGMKR